MGPGIRKLKKRELCNDRRDSQSYQTHKSQPKSQSSSLHRYDKVRDGSSDPTPPYKMLRRSDESPVSRHGDNTGHGKAKTSHAIRGKNGTSSSPQENSHNNSSHHGSDSHATQNKPADRVRQCPALSDETTSGDQSTASNAGHSSSSSSAQNLNSAPGALGSTPSSMSSSSSSSTGQLLQSVQSPSPALLQDPALLHQLLPALQATLQMNNGSMDMAKLNEVLAAAVTQASLRSVLHKLLTAGPAFNVTALLSAAQHSNQAQHSSQSPVSLTSDASSPRPYVSPRNGTPQSNQKSLLGVHPGSITSSQTRGSMSSGKQGSVALSQTAEKRPEDPRTLQQRRHIQGWPSENTEKQAARLHEDIHNMGSLYMSEICTEMKNLRSLVRVCEIQATLREQRILFLRQQSKELDKLKNQNSYMV
ncbi:hypothetical protein INR49_000312 [Caranx melampygus]|nr:hypothetical protein INR49_000312 [Caranx melampygus]